ncbi:MAG TPA: SHOCT domain-containing protein [Acidimicrobiia bacterium]
MVLAADWTFGDFFLAVLYVFAWVILFWLVITVFVDVFRRRDISGWVKALWVIVVVLIPWLGVLIYLISQHDGMAERSERAAVQERDQLRHVVGYSPADELEKLDRMKSEGKLSDEEYQRLRARVLS